MSLPCFPAKADFGLFGVGVLVALGSASNLLTGGLPDSSSFLFSIETIFIIWGHQAILLNLFKTWLSGKVYDVGVMQNPKQNLKNKN